MLLYTYKEYIFKGNLRSFQCTFPMVTFESEAPDIYKIKHLQYYFIKMRTIKAIY